MYDKLNEQILIIGEKIIGFLPNLLAGIALFLLGIILGWIAKKVAMQLMTIFRFERMLTRFRWGKGFSKADIRYGLYGAIGDSVFVVIFLIFLNSALNALQLTILSGLLERFILVIPRLIVALIIFVIGWLIASGASKAIQRTLARDHIHRSALISRFVKGVLIVFFTAISLTELNFAREIVIIGFSTIFITLGVIAIVIIALGGKEYLSTTRESGEDGSK